MNPVSIRPFIGAKDFNLSRRFYAEIEFEERSLSGDMALFRREGVAFYLQEYYVKEWIENTMVFLEVDDLDLYLEGLAGLDLISRYPGVKLSAIREEAWGREAFLHDPAGVLWHIGEFR